MTQTAQSERDWALALFGRSVLKQAKWREIARLLPPLEGQACLDVGADNGVISLLLRQKGGLWHSADLDPKAVASIERLVGQRVHQLDGGPTEFADGQFDLVVIVDFLEHITGDRAFCAELARIIRPGGRLVVNVPHVKPGLIEPLRHALGLTDAWHGHVRPGYTAAGLADTLGPGFRVERVRTYSKAFSEAMDAALNFLYTRKNQGRGRDVSTAKGVVIDQADWQAHAKQLKLLKTLYPFMRAWSLLDGLLFFTRGYKLIVSAQRVRG